MLMYDSVDASKIPAGALAVAGYVDGAYAWSPADWARFPSAVKLTIATSSRSSADILDVERGDATPGEVPAWCDAFTRPGRRAPTVYCSRASWPAVQAAVGARRVDYWISTLDGTTSVPGAVAVQYLDAGPYDESLILDASWLELPEDAMTIDTARAIVHQALALQGILGDQAQVDSYASQMLPPANPEIALSNLEADIKADPRSLWSRVAALEAK